MFLRKDQLTAVTDATTEIVFEWVCRAKYPHRPSCFQSLLAVADIESAMEFMRQTNGFGSPIFEVNPDYAFSADMRLLNANQTTIVKFRFAVHHAAKVSLPRMGVAAGKRPHTRR